MADPIHVDLPDEQATLALGAKLSGLGGSIFLYGELGAGKTTFVRGFLRGLGYQGAVKSPTYTLIEPYEIDGRRLFHLDIYRLADASELEDTGIRDELEQGNTLLVEWPERAQGLLGEPQLEVRLEYINDARQARLWANDPGMQDQLTEVFSRHK